MATISHHYLIVHDGVDEDGDAVLGEDLLRWDLERLAPHVNLFIDIHARNDKKDAGSARPAGEEAAQPEDDCPLVLLVVTGKIK